MTPIGLNQPAHLISQAGLLCTLIVNQYQGRNMIITQNKNTALNARTSKKIIGHLSKHTIQKMLLRLLENAKIVKPKLAECLDITTTELLRLTENRAPLELIQRISLPLVKLYCSTKFINQ